jgi:hypothetical protein
MPKNTDQEVSLDWEQITNADVTEITFQNTGGRAVIIQATSGTTSPTDDAGLVYQPGQGEANRSLSEIFPGVSGANRVWARVDNLTTTLFVSHA